MWLSCWHRRQHLPAWRMQEVAYSECFVLLLSGLGGITTVKALQAVMYRDMKGWGGAYKLLNATGTIGSQGTGAGKKVA